MISLLGGRPRSIVGAARRTAPAQATTTHAMTAPAASAESDDGDHGAHHATTAPPATAPPTTAPPTTAPPTAEPVTIRQSARAAWPLVGLIALYPLWWALGLGVLIFAIAAVPMAVSL